MVDRRRLALLLDRERSEYVARNPRSAAAYAAGRHLVGGVPMTWMAKNPGGFPLYLAEASGARVLDLDDHELIDFSLGDTGAMAGHSPGPVVDAVTKRLATGGATAMLPTEDAEVVAAELARRFRVDRWSFALSATDANRWALRLARAVTKRPRILVNTFCYHGSVDESLVVAGPGGTAVSRPGSVGPPGDVGLTSRVAEYNDLAGLERELRHGDVAAVLMEPALTNVGIVLPDPGFLAGVREMTRTTGTLLINDETHTFSAGPGGCTRAWSLEPDVVTIGKAIGGGIPIGAYGLTDELAERVAALDDVDLVDTGGVGGTLAGNAVSLAAARATLTEVLTAGAFEWMTARCTRYAIGVRGIIETHGLPWSIAQLGGRAEYCFAGTAPRNGTEALAAAVEELADYLHLRLLNRGVLLTPFHNMALMCPATVDADVDVHLEVLTDAVEMIAG